MQLFAVAESDRRNSRKMFAGNFKDDWPLPAWHIIFAHSFSD